TTTTVNLLTGFEYTEYEPRAQFRPDPLPIEIPLRYGTLPLTDAIDSPPYRVAIYQHRIVAVFDTSNRVAALYDFEKYVFPPANRRGKGVVGEATLTTPEGTYTGDV